MIAISTKSEVIVSSKTFLRLSRRSFQWKFQQPRSSFTPFVSISPGDSLPRTSFFSNYCLTLHTGPTFTDCEEVVEQCLLFLIAALMQSKWPAACINFPLAQLCNYFNLWTWDEMLDDMPRCFTRVVCYSCTKQTHQSLSVRLESVFLLLFWSVTGIDYPGWPASRWLSQGRWAPPLWCNVYSLSFLHSPCYILPPSAVAMSHTLYRQPSVWPWWKCAEANGRVFPPLVFAQQGKT